MAVSIVMLWLFTFVSIASSTQCRLDKAQKNEIKRVDVYTFENSPTATCTSSDGQCEGFSFPSDTMFFRDPTSGKPDTGAYFVGEAITGLRLNVTSSFYIEVWMSKNCLPCASVQGRIPIGFGPPIVDCCIVLSVIGSVSSIFGSGFDNGFRHAVNTVETSSDDTYQTLQTRGIYDTTDATVEWASPGLMGLSQSSNPATRDGEIESGAADWTNFSSKDVIWSGWDSKSKRHHTGLGQGSKEQDLKLDIPEFTYQLLELSLGGGESTNDVLENGVSARATPLHGMAIYYMEDPMSDFTVFSDSIAEHDCGAPNSIPLASSHRRSFPENAVSEFSLCPDGVFTQDNSCIDIENFSPFSETNNNLTIMITELSWAGNGIGTLKATDIAGGWVDVSDTLITRTITINRNVPLRFEPAKDQTSWRVSMDQLSPGLADIIVVEGSDDVKRTGYNTLVPRATPTADKDLPFATLTYKVVDEYGEEHEATLKIFVHPVHDGAVNNRNVTTHPIEFTANSGSQLQPAGVNKMTFAEQHQIGARSWSVNTIFHVTDKVDSQKASSGGSTSNEQADSLEFPPGCYDETFSFKCYPVHARLHSIIVTELPDTTLGYFYWKNGTEDYVRLKVSDEVKATFPYQEFIRSEKPAIVEIYFYGESEETGDDLAFGTFKYQVVTEHLLWNLIRAPAGELGRTNWTTTNTAARLTDNPTTYSDSARVDQGQPLNFAYMKESDELEVRVVLQNSLKLESTGTPNQRLLVNEHVRCAHEPIPLDVDITTPDNLKFEVYLSTLPSRGTMYKAKADASGPGGALLQIDFVTLQTDLISPVEGILVGTFEQDDYTFQGKFLYYKTSEQYEYSLTEIAYFEYFLVYPDGRVSPTARVAIKVQDCDDPPVAQNLMNHSEATPLLCSGSSVLRSVGSFGTSWCETSIGFADPAEGQYQDGTAKLSGPIVNNEGYLVTLYFPSSRVFKVFLNDTAWELVKDRVVAPNPAGNIDTRSFWSVRCSLEDCRILFESLRLAPRTREEIAETCSACREEVAFDRGVLRVEIKQGPNDPETEIEIHTLFHGPYPVITAYNFRLYQNLLIAGYFFIATFVFFLIFVAIIFIMNKTCPTLLPQPIKNLFFGEKKKSTKNPGADASHRYLHNI